MYSRNDVLNFAKETLGIEIKALVELEEQIDESFYEAVKCILACDTKVIVTGMGKSGIIGKKISATLASTGTPSFFVHPGEAFHGDLGMISPGDVVVGLSYSGETDELLKIIPYIKNYKIPLVAITGKENSTLAKNSDFLLKCEVQREACPLELAPTSSTTAALVLGDALAVALMNCRGFKREDFAEFHPGGSLGKRLLTFVDDKMMSENLPLVEPHSTIKEVINTITNGQIGLALVQEKGALLGIITDGDLRRTMEKSEANFFEILARDIMSDTPVCIRIGAKVTEAEKLMNTKHVNSLVVLGSENEILGVLPYKKLF